MRKLTVDEIIQGLVDAYERLLVLEAKVSHIDAPSPYDKDYNEVKGEVKALRWVLGQEKCSIDGTMPVIKVFKHDHRFAPIEDAYNAIDDEDE
tara:strand:+ start:172 stop:450 length:279 start_codon:yes stop_codon:yes gene_type:complete